ITINQAFSRMKRPQNLSNAELRAELATYNVHVFSMPKSKRAGYEDQLIALRTSGPPEPVEKNPDARRIKCDLDTITKEMKKNQLALRPHQVEALHTFWEWHEQGRGGILGDEMGLGKTCTTIVHLMRLRKLGYGPFLVVPPLSVVDHWIKEIDRFSCGLLKPEFIDSNQLLRGAYLSEYQAFSKNMVVILAQSHAEQRLDDGRAARLFTGSIFDMVVIDEAQRCKRSGGKLHTRCMKLSSRFLLLTGTPIQNSLNELYSLLSIVDRKRFPTLKEEEWSDEHADKPETVKKILAGYFLRRAKELVCKELPPINQIIFYHGLTEQQTKLYLDVLHVDHSVVSAKKYNSLICLHQQLRKITAHPWLMNGQEPEPFEENEEMVKASEKLTVIDRLLKFLLDNGHSVLIFSQLTMFLDVIEDFLNMRGLSFARIDGRVGLDERIEHMDKFNASTRDNGGPRIFLLSTRAGGLGLNLTNADTVLFVDSDWNPQVDLQAMARSHRIGQTKPVRVIRLVGRYTVEQYLQAKARSKLHLTDKIIGSTDEHLSAVAMMKYIEEQAEDLEREQTTKIDLTEAAIEKIVGKTGRNGLWIPIDEEEEKKMEDDQLELIQHVDENDKRDVDINDYRKFKGKEFRMNTRDRDELILQINAVKYSGSRLTGTVVETELENDRELRLAKLREMEVKRQEKRERNAKRRSQEAKMEGTHAKVTKKEEENEDDDDEVMIVHGELLQGMIFYL
ncbi:hypothetical protein PENTCL1PPCAC_18453, partial [Pristionchus entomophagus]